MNISNHLTERRNVFVTDRYLGSRTEIMQVGDGGYWIAGISVPMVLRPGEMSAGTSGVTAIGPTFVYGSMGL